MKRGHPIRSTPHRISCQLLFTTQDEKVIELGPLSHLRSHKPEPRHPFPQDFPTIHNHGPSSPRHLLERRRFCGSGPTRSRFRQEVRTVVWKPRESGHPFSFPERPPARSLRKVDMAKNETAGLLDSWTVGPRTDG